MVEPTEEQPQGGPAPPPLDLGECVTGLANAVARGMEEQVAPYNLIPLEFAILRAFLGREEWTTTQLAKALPVTLSRISRIVTKLVDRDLLRRRRLRSDRRVVALALTEDGKALTSELHRSVQAYDASSLRLRSLQGHAEPGSRRASARRSKQSSPPFSPR